MVLAIFAIRRAFGQFSVASTNESSRYFCRITIELLIYATAIRTGEYILAVAYVVGSNPFSGGVR